MKIDITKMRITWWEDAEGNVLELEGRRAPTNEEKKKYCYYHSEFPCQIAHNTSYYDSQSRTFKDCGTFYTTFKSGSDCIVAMVNSGDYTLEEAIWVYAHACERCMNALCYKYLNGKDGYAEYSDMWQRCGTECDFCRGDQIDETHN